MKGQKFEDRKCRICWTEDEELDWNNLLSSQGDMTYRYCFYKYTQLQCIDEHSFSNMICHNCANGLEYIDAFISRAIETNSKLREVWGMNNTEEMIHSTTESESIHVEEIEIKEEEQTSIIYEENKNFNVSENAFREARLSNDVTNLKEISCKSNQTLDYLLDKQELLISENETEKGIPKEVSINDRVGEKTVNTTNFTVLVRQLRKYYFELSHSRSKRRRKRNNEKSLDKRSNEGNLTESYIVKQIRLNSNDTDENYIENQAGPSSNVITKKGLGDKTESNKTGEKIFLCQYCSAEIKGWSNLHIHESKHSEVRKRTETCAQCGVKFYNKKSLRMHEKTHNVNRKKRFKCEFCEKAFYSMGGLNVHKRIHLGLMVKCQICSKEFFRNIELYKHMNSHSSSLINVEVKKRSRYFVRCKHCGKKILSTSFKSHTAAHLNQPLVKCSICNKEYFNRESCRHHIRTIHIKKPEAVNEYVVLLNTDRLTSLYIRQNADMEPEEK